MYAAPVVSTAMASESSQVSPPGLKSTTLEYCRAPLLPNFAAKTPGPPLMGRLCKVGKPPPVMPVMYALLELSRAIALPSAHPAPPRYVEYTSVFPAAPRTVKKALESPFGLD